MKYYFLSLFDKIFPKKNVVIFNSFPDISGNPLALYKYIVEERRDILHTYIFVWTVGDITPEEGKYLLKQYTGIENHRVIRKKSLDGIVAFLSSKYIFSTHGYFMEVVRPKNQIHINLWHGMPFKRIGKMLEEVHANGKSDEADLTIATSELFQEIMACSFGINKESVILSGQPCNDDLFISKDVLGRLGIVPKDYCKVIVWMPTYRKSVIGDIRQDGKKDSFGVAEVVNSHYSELVSCLKKNNYLLLVKPHPMDCICDMSFPQNKYFKVILNEDLFRENIVLYELLSSSDCLLTDYSSVFIDYLITNKPIAFVCDDMEDYEKTRGFSVNNPKDFMPGPIIKNFEELISYLWEMDLINEKWSGRYQEIKKVLNPMSDAFASKRVCESIFGK